MGAGDSRSVSYGLDEEENVTVLQGVKLSNDVFQRMRQSGPSPERPASPKPESAKSDPGSARSSPAERQEELRRRFEREQALVQDELSRISIEREAAGEDLRTMNREELKNTQDLARQLRKKEDELQHLAKYYKEQLQLMDKKNSDFYQQSLQMYSQDAVKRESTVRSCNISPICSELQSQVLNCYRENKHQTLHCSQLARQYIHCINSSKKNLLVNDG
ncbi:coiled-coil-helix-coiled-coil-helix domain containing 6b isoform X2 [Paramisgurnus dabryanus]|uniref:coiled-coil-helix-coiled-coil-helix domain containing 6b isoform X2 n=1 Tax=Paramisgurnus dabryanus TaxID=90735 RepID=UPI0031F374DF